MTMYQPDPDRLSTGKTSGAPMPFDVEAFTIQARELVEQGDRVPAQRVPVRVGGACEDRGVTLTDFLLVRIGEDEARASVYDGEWTDRVLAECEAKRRIIEAHPESRALNYCETCFSGDYGRLDDPLHEDWPCPTLRALAAVYADHPDFPRT